MGDNSFIFESPLLPLVEHAFGGVAFARPNPWRLVYANSALSALLKASGTELSERGLEQLIRTSPPSLLNEAITAVWQGTSKEATISGELIGGGSFHAPVELRFVRIAMPDEALLGIVVRDAGHAQAVTSAGPELRRDPLTRLHDRAFLLARIDERLKQKRIPGIHFAALFIDLDNFKQINDAFGHLVGDGVLVEIARRLSDCVREEDHVARFGGDEFVVLLEGIADRRDIQPVVDRIHRALEVPIKLADGEFRLSVSIGAAEASPEFHSPEELLAAADRAMYASKHRGS